MNEYQAKKLGEVLAFLKVGAETAEKGKTGLEKVFSSSDVKNLIEEDEQVIKKVEDVAKQQEVFDVVFSKSEKTGEKLRKMRDLYIGDEWGDPAELLEWSGFFQGAAIVHWGLVQGVAERNGIKDLEDLTNNAIKTHEKRLAVSAEKLKEIGSGK